MIVTGNLKDFSLSDIIKMSCVDIQTCQIIIKTNAGEGVIYFSNGMPVHAQLANTTGEEAVYRLLDETEKYGGVFRVEPDVVLPKRTITTTWDLILENRNNRTRETSPIRNTGVKTFDKDSYLGRREAITRVLENFRAQSAKRVPPVTPKPTPVVQPEQPVRPVTTTLEEVAPPPAPIAEPVPVVRPVTPKPNISGRGASLTSILNSFIERGRDIVEGVALVSTEGFIIASVLPEELEDEHVAAISAVVVSLGERITRELRRGTMEQVYVRGKFGYVFLTQAGADALLTVITNPNAKLGMIFLDTKRTIQELESLL
ncbi:roadblock/LC7 domain-containing protein [candidate division KSB1 bacterium]|nr:roadblock/LC7 domain-containing protein [candidate division KSB1 bacterium]